jgi:hypothetical protein
MSKTTFEASVLLVGAAFTIAFGVIVVPALIESGDIAGAFAAASSIRLLRAIRWTRFSAPSS